MPGHDAMREERDVAIKMRDGTILQADVFRPLGNGEHPTLVIRTPYGDDLPQTSVPAWVAAGYAVVVQDCRGRWRSSGEWTPFVVEPADGYDTIEWAARQSWSDGNVGTTGFSYLGLTQTMTALAAPPSLRSAVPASAAARPYRFVHSAGGVPQLSFPVGWMADVARNTAERTAFDDDLLAVLPSFGAAAVAFRDHGPEAALEVRRAIARAHRAVCGTRPLRSLTMIGALAPWVLDWFDHPDERDSYWADVDLLAHADRITTPMLHIAGWFDFFVDEALAMFSALNSRGVPQHIVIGPWFHGSFGGRQSGDVDFGAAASADLFTIERRWHDHWLRGIDTGALDEAPVRLFVMGDDVWRDEQEWPLARTDWQRWHFHADSRLARSAPAGRAAPPSTYDHDPDDPAPMWGGRPGQSGRSGSYDQLQREARADVLSFTSDVLQQRVEVTGPVRAEVWASSSAGSLDLVVTLVDVHPDGAAMNVTEGASRVGGPFPMRVDVELFSTSYAFAAGHRLRIDVASSATPQYLPNPGTDVAIGADGPGEGVVARQTVFHDTARPSAIVLPVIP